MPETDTFDPTGDCYRTQNQKYEITQVDREHAQGYREAQSV
jgi:hypothetical protein